MESYVIANARIVSPADGLDVTGSVRIAGGKIVSVGPLPEIQPEDTVLDAGAAKNAGCPFCAVLNGTTPAGDFADFHPVHIAPDLFELRQWLEG